MEYLSHLAKDKRLKKLIDEHEPFRLGQRKHIHIHLCGSIMSQQLSTKVAATIQKRFLDLYKGRTPLPEDILSTPLETLRSIGLSHAKTNYVHNVARFAIEQGLDPVRMNKMDNEEVIAYLSQIKGVGRWTAEMLLMFTLGREDVFAIDDLGIQSAMIGIYKLDNSDRKAFRETLLNISGKWSPYRTFACLHLWHWKDNSPGKTADGKKALPKTKGRKEAKGVKGAKGSPQKEKKARK
jgi:DNA-3-methyladenine glycosylase II